MCIIYIHIMADGSILFNAMKYYFGHNATDTGNRLPNVGVLDKALEEANGNVSAALSKQDDVSDILNDEIDRLNKKKSQINNSQKGQMRVLMMNESYRKRQSEYLKLIIAVVIVFALVIIMRYMRVYFNVLPGAISTLIHILLFASVIIYSFVIYINVSSREKINYDRLALPAPDIESSTDYEKRNAAAKKSGDLLGVSNSNLCKGSVCCTEDVTKWDTESKKCIGLTETVG
jgi:glucan phosphoethanolaminetransferase (alkaline phosphatase superfamily)